VSSPRWILLTLLLAGQAHAQQPADVLVVVNYVSPLSRSIADYYVLRRSIPLNNVCRITAPVAEDILRADYDRVVAASIADCLRAKHLEERILYIVTTAGVPLRISGTPGLDGLDNDAASVDSELTLLYSEMHGVHHATRGPLGNPFFGRKDAAFRHPDFPIYLVTRLAGYDFPDVRAMIDRSLAARNQGRFVIDMKSDDDQPGNNWLRDAALKLPAERVILDTSTKVLTNQTGVIGYASWGSNDPNRKQRHLGFRFNPGAIVTEYVSTNARTFARPPDSWTLGNWNDQDTWFGGSPQTLTADYIHDGATGASGHVLEPFLHLNPRPDLLLPAYYSGRNLAESYYLSIPALSWVNVVIGDPLCSLGKP
jgi:uncharacterized protein (TIGR03790 family)